MDKLLNASPNPSRTVLTAAKVLNVTGSDANPHLWYSMSLVKRMAAAIEQQLAGMDPASKAEYQQNLSTVDASLQPILAVEATIRKKYAQTPVAYTERVPGYLLEDCDLAVKTPPGFASAIEDGTDPSPADALAMDTLITRREIKVLLYNSQDTSSVTKHVRKLARKFGIPVVKVSETRPEGEKSFQSWQLDQANSLLAALGN